MHYDQRACHLAGFGVSLKAVGLILKWRLNRLMTSIKALRIQLSLQVTNAFDVHLAGFSGAPRVTGSTSARRDSTRRGA